MAFFVQNLWAHGINFLLKIVGIRIEVRGTHNIPDKPCLIACKHQSAWDTSVFFSIIPGSAIVAKKELLKLPLFGWYMKKLEEIPIDRSAGGAALREMIRASKKALAKGRHIIIFPEGTRVNIDEKRNFQTGVYALYNMLNIPVVPVALNSGYFWPRHSKIKHSGTIILEFLPPISGRIGKKEFMTKLENKMNKATENLLNEARHKT